VCLLYLSLEVERMLRRIRSMAGHGVRHPNFHAASVALTAAAALSLNADPLPAGSEPLAVIESELAILSTTAAPRIICPPLISVVQAPLSDGIDPQAVPAAVQPAAATEVATAPQQSGALTGKWAMQMSVLILQKGMAEFSKVPDYTATFTKIERIDGDLTDEQQIGLKVRQAPFSVYMKWRSGGERGQQVIYVHQQNEGNMLVKPGGIKGRLFKEPLPLDPHGAMAMSQARYPVMMVGLHALADRIVKLQLAQIERGHGFQCEFRDDVEFDSRPCYRCFVTYESEADSPEYRQSEIIIDKQLSMPVFVRNWTWGRDVDPATIDEATLIEHYAYTDVQISQQLADNDFDKTNEEYHMVR
jgi:hypothetical protein